VHIHTLLLGSFSPAEERDFLYSPKGEFHGEAALLLNALEITAPGKTTDAVQAEFQRAGFFLTHVLECPVEPEDTRTTVVASLLAEHVPVAAARIRRSLKPKRVVLVTKALEPIVENILHLELGCPVVMDDGKPFDLDGGAPKDSMARLRKAVSSRTTD
jgi:hypothetical protein